MEEAHTCKICMDNEVEVVISCINCAYKLKDCAVGRKFIKRIVMTFMSWNFFSQAILT